jgi:hypothetical protein
MAAIDKTKIIEAIRQTDDERILFAINRLLQIENEEIPEWQKQELDRRSERRNNDDEEVYDWESIKEDIKKSD